MIVLPLVMGILARGIAASRLGCDTAPSALLVLYVGAFLTGAANARRA
jgi:hypothetical protein